MISLTLQRQPDNKRNGILPAHGPDLPAVKRKDLLRDRKPKTCPARIRHAGGIQPIEFIKQQRQLFRRDRFSLILKREQDIRVRLFGKNAYPGMRIKIGRAHV